MTKSKLSWESAFLSTESGLQRNTASHLVRFLLFNTISDCERFRIKTPKKQHTSYSWNSFKKQVFMYLSKQALYQYLLFQFLTGFDDSTVGKLLPRHYFVINIVFLQN